MDPILEGTIWIVGAGLVGVYSERKGNGFARGFLLSILFSLMVGFLITGFIKGKR